MLVGFDDDLCRHHLSNCRKDDKCKKNLRIKLGMLFIVLNRQYGSMGCQLSFSEEIIVFFNKHVAGFLKRENNMTYCNLLGTISI